MNTSFDLLSTVEAGGCSAKLSPSELAEILKTLPKVTHPDLLVDIETHDDAGVYRISPDLALVQTVDFFPPVCSDPYDFGQIAAANALSDVYAMGGRPLTAMNLMMFPSKKIPHEAFAAILRGGYDKVTESGAVIVGGHTIDDYPPKYGLSVTGLVHPDRIMTNAAARPGDMLILTKRIGTGVAVAGRKAKIPSDKSYDIAIASMKHLNRTASEIMLKYLVHCVTDITGFSLLGHALKLATASGVTLCIDPERVPLIDGVLELAQTGCIPGASFRNQEFAESSCANIESVDYSLKMLLFDAQTSGGLLICVPSDSAQALLDELHAHGENSSAIIGAVVAQELHPIRIGRI